MSNSHARLVRALVFACFFPLCAIAFAKATVAQKVTDYGHLPPQGAPVSNSAPIAVR